MQDVNEAKNIEGWFMKYNIDTEYINIKNYSPFSHINEVSKKYQFNSFELPFIFISGRNTPVHPDTFDDLGLEENQIKYTVLVYPTSSFRTVYDPQKNICYKLPLLRQITRGVRGLSYNELDRSEESTRLLKNLKYKNFNFLREICLRAKDENFNFIVRKMPDKKVYPLFYVVAQQSFCSELMKKVVVNMINSWMFYASNGILLEYHTQNILVDEEANIYYRDLGDVVFLNNLNLSPRYVLLVENISEILSLVFDRTVCSQNLDHIFKYDLVLGDNFKKEVKRLIRDEISKYDLKFPDYSLNFPIDSQKRIPQKTVLNYWRD